MDPENRVTVGAGVRTPDGPGLCWQAFADRVGVILAHDPRHVVFYHPREVMVDPLAKLRVMPHKGRRGKKKDHEDQRSFFGDAT